MLHYENVSQCSYYKKAPIVPWTKWQCYRVVTYEYFEKTPIVLWLKWQYYRVVTNRYQHLELSVVPQLKRLQHWKQILYLLNIFFLRQYPIIPSSHEFLLVEYIFFLSYNFPCSRLCYETSTPTSQEPSSTIAQVCLWICEGSVTPDQISYTCHVPSRINQYRLILTKYQQVPTIVVLY